MKVKELIKTLKMHDQNSQIVFGSDEELNTMHVDCEVAELVDDKKNPIGRAVLYPLHDRTTSTHISDDDHLDM